MDGRLAEGAFVTRFYLPRVSLKSDTDKVRHERNTERGDDDPDHFLLHRSLGNVNQQGYNVVSPKGRGWAPRGNQINKCLTY
jgi:hypothetical protein